MMVDRSGGRTPARAMPRPRAGRLVPALIIALIVAGWFTGRGGYALFDGMNGSANRFATGTVVLTDDDSGGAVVSLVLAQPGDTSIGCLDVSYAGSLDASVRLYAT